MEEKKNVVLFGEKKKQQSGKKKDVEEGMSQLITDVAFDSSLPGVSIFVRG